MDFSTLGINLGIKRQNATIAPTASKQKHRIVMRCFRGDPGRIRTADTWFRRPVL